jgi:hypothetical protein
MNKLHKKIKRVHWVPRSFLTVSLIYEHNVIRFQKRRPAPEAGFFMAIFVRPPEGFNYQKASSRIRVGAHYNGPWPNGNDVIWDAPLMDMIEAIRWAGDYASVEDEWHQQAIIRAELLAAEDKRRLALRQRTEQTELAPAVESLIDGQVGLAA